jgi:cation transport protein ChaC
VEATVNVQLDDGRRVRALSFLSDRAHPQWAGVMSLETQAALIAGAQGLSGRNADYLRDLVGHLNAEGMPDRGMERLLGKVDALEALS